MPAPHQLVRAALWSGTGLAAAWTVVRVAGLEAGSPAVALMAFTPYVAAGSLVPLVSALALRRWREAVVAAAVAATLAVAVLPRALPDDQGDAGGGTRLRVLTANVHFGDVPAADVIALLRRLDADVVAFEELSTGLVRDLDQAGIGTLLPHRILPNGVSQDSALYSRYPLRTVRAACDPVVAEPCALIDVPGRPVEVRAVHPAAPHDAENTRKSHRSLDALPGAPRDGPPRILAGDFNATLDHAALRRVLDTGYRDAADAVGAGLLPTWPTGGRVPPVTIDHVLVDRRIRVRAVTTHGLSRTDHRAVFADLELPR